jgi:hypothetical protein
MFRAVTTGHHGGNRRSPPENKSDNVTLEPKRGNRRAYVLSRLKRSRPDLFDKVVAGKMTANAAAIEATMAPYRRFDCQVVLCGAR